MATRGRRHQRADNTSIVSTTKTNYRYTGDHMSRGGANIPIAADIRVWLEFWRAERFPGNRRDIPTRATRACGADVLTPNIMIVNTYRALDRTHTISYIYYRTCNNTTGGCYLVTRTHIISSAYRTLETIRCGDNN